MLNQCKRVTVQALSSAMLLSAASSAYAACDPVGHPGVQPRPGISFQSTSADGMTTTVVTPEGNFPVEDPWGPDGGSNLLDVVYENACDSAGREVPNTVPSTPDNPYNLHPDPIVTPINKTSPSDDLQAARKAIREAAFDGAGTFDIANMQLAIDVLEGNPIPDRVYSGLPMLHYNGPNKVGVVQPITDGQGNTIGGNLDIHQVWFDGRIEGDVAFIDPSAVLEVPWTITYTIDTLNRGEEDFAPTLMLFDPPDATGSIPLPLVGFDQTFFPMEDGYRYVYEVKMPPGKYYNLTYHWGWRIHAPRVQVTENALKVVGGKSLPQWEIDVFGEDPRASEAAKEAAIEKIGDLAPAKRMWAAARKMKRFATGQSGSSFEQRMKQVRKEIGKFDAAFLDWGNRTKVPDGFSADPDSDVTIVYLNNTMYGEMRDFVRDDRTFLGDNQPRLPDWRLRPFEFKVKLYNGDYFEHKYQNVDFGGSRGWENTFFSTVEIGGAGPWFTFGRFHWWVNAGAPPWPYPLITVPAAIEGGMGEEDTPGEHNVHMTLNFEPSRRLRLYQFDPIHHDVAVWSIH